MNKREIVARPAGSLFRALDTLAADADRIVKLHAELRAFRVAGKPIAELDSKQVALGEHGEKLVARCQAALAELEPDTSYDERGCLRIDIVGVRLSSMAIAFPNGAPGDPDGYTRMVLEHVCAVPELSLIALDAACRQIVATKTFFPTVSEILQAIREQRAIWDARVDAIWDIEDLSRRIVAEIEAQKGDGASN